MGAYILITTFVFWCTLAFSLNDTLTDAAINTAADLVDRDLEFLSMLVLCIGFLLALPYIIVFAIIDIIRR